MRARQGHEAVNATKCALCKDNYALRDSHFIPKALYRLCRSPDPSKGVSSDPINLSPKGAVQSSYQLKSKLLCENCEDKFSKEGERIVIRDCFRGTNEFLLRDELRVANPDFVSDSSHWFSGAKLGSIINVQSYKYFAASMFWRGSAGRWSGPGSNEWRGTLGEKYQEEFRQYLLGICPFPHGALLVIFIANEVDPLIFATVTSSKKENGYHLHKFYIPGVEFRMFLGSRIEAPILSVFEYLKTDTIFVLQDSRSNPGFPDIVNWVRSTKPKGKLQQYSKK
jgi:hypothetical protein